MKRSNTVSWKDSPSKGEEQQKRRTLSLNSKLKTCEIDKLSQLVNKTGSSNAKDIFATQLESIETKEIEMNDLSSSFSIEDEFFSENIFRQTFEIKKIEKEIDSIKLYSENITCIVMDSWMEIDFYVNMRISVINCPCCSNSRNTNIDNVITVDDQHNYIVIEDRLFPVTSICNSIRCIYSSLLKDSILDLEFDFSHQSLAVGVIMHNVTELCLKRNDFNLKFIVNSIRNEIKNSVKILYSCNMTEKNATIECMRFVKEILSLEKKKYEIVDTESKFVSQNLGIRGIIDAVALSKDVSFPIEIKTGKVMDVQHRAQTLLYALMMKENQRNSLDYGYLLYIQTGKTVKVTLKHHEIRSLAILRNKLSSLFFSSRFSIENTQNPVKFPSLFRPECSCPEVENCKLIANIFQIDGPKGDFLREQWNAINEEEGAQSGTVYHKTFFKSQYEDEINVSCRDTGLEKLEEFISIYNKDKIKLCSAKILRIENHVLTIKISERINMKIFNEILVSNTRNELFYKLMRFSLLKIAPQIDFIYKKTDSQKNSYKSSPFSTAEKYIEILSSVKNDPSPQFKIGIPSIYKDEFMKLNDDQRSALYLSLNCEKYRLIHGFPGTGKSTLIALLIKILVHMNKKVLLICYTNLAIENILKRIKINYYRALKDKKVFDTTAEMKEYFENIKLVVGTCFSFTDIIFIKRRFDYCIIDEASQQHLLLSLIPIYLSEKFILVGDHLQLNPLTVKNEKLKKSLFEHIMKKEVVSELKTQYRMADEIMKIPNTMFYKNKMKGCDKKGEIVFIDSKKYNNINEIIDKMNINGNATILCYYNSQVSIVRAIVGDKCRVETIDRFQGSESEEVILVFDPVVECDISLSRARLNVGLTRAEKKLIMIGDKEKMENIKVFKEMFETMLDSGYIFLKE